MASWASTIELPIPYYPLAGRFLLNKDSFRLINVFQGTHYTDLGQTLFARKDATVVLILAELSLLLFQHIPLPFCVPAVVGIRKVRYVL